MSKKRYCYLVIALQAGLMLGAISNMMKIGAAEVAMAITGNIQKVFSQLNGEGKNTDMVNPHGIIFGEDAKINVGSIYASNWNVNKIYLEAFESSSVLVGKITASKLGQADWPGGNQGWLAVKQQQGGGHFFGTSGKSGSIASP
jgi:filamentous hemagglutinin family protein